MPFSLYSLALAQRRHYCQLAPLQEYPILPLVISLQRGTYAQCAADKFYVQHPGIASIRKN